MMNGVKQTIWRTESYPSGTTIVTSREPDVPWLYVYGPKPVGPVDEEGDDRQAIRNRYAVCDELAMYLNGARRPAWLDDMQRVSESKLGGVDGSSITAVGPTCKDPADPSGWRYRDDAEAKDLRARLIDRIQFDKH